MILFLVVVTVVALIVWGTSSPSSKEEDTRPIRRRPNPTTKTTNNIQRERNVTPPSSSTTSRTSQTPPPQRQPIEDDIFWTVSDEESNTPTLIEGFENLHIIMDPNEAGRVILTLWTTEERAEGFRQLFDDLHIRRIKRTSELDNHMKKIFGTYAINLTDEGVIERYIHLPQEDLNLSQGTKQLTIPKQAISKVGYYNCTNCKKQVPSTFYKMSILHSMNGSYFRGSQHFMCRSCFERNVNLTLQENGRVEVEYPTGAIKAFG